MTFSVDIEIASAFCPSGIDSSEQLNDGEINTTFLLTDANKRKVILQRLSHISDRALGDDYNVMSSHLGALGWEIATPLKTLDGEYYVADESGTLWRSFRYIESQPGSTYESSPEAYIAVGALLGKVHHDLSRLNYKPKAASPYFQNLTHYTKRLAATLPEISDASSKNLGEAMLAEARRSSFDDAPTQLVHGDPRMANVLFRNNMPFTFIDWDDLRQANPLIDMGDLLGSATDRMLRKNPDYFSDSLLVSMIEAYYEAANPSADKYAYIASALNAGRIVALMGGMRRLIDSVEDQIFGWDTIRFSSRQEANLSRAQDWWQASRALDTTHM